MSEKGKSSPRPYPPTASSAAAAGAPAELDPEPAQDAVDQLGVIGQQAFSLGRA